MYAFIDDRPLIYVGGLLLVYFLAVLLWYGTRGRSDRHPRLRTTLAVVFLGYTAAAWFLLAGPYVGRKSERTYAITWEVIDGEASGHGPGAVLTFKDYPGHSFGIDSGSIVEELVARAAGVVEVDIQITTTYGRMNGFRALRIAGIDVPMGGAGGYRIMGRREGSPSPWPAR